MGRPKRKAPSKDELDHFTWTEDHIAAAGLAYKENNVSDLDDVVKLNPGWHHYKTIDNPNGIRYKIWLSPTNGNVLVSFRGTSSLKEAIIDATMGSTVFKTATGIDVGHVYKGFGDAWNQIKDQLTNEMRYLKSTTFLKDGSTLQFSGHSLGGSMSDIASTYYADMFPSVQVLTTSVAGPTAADKQFNEYAMHQANIKRTRIVSPGDMIANTKLPGMDFMPTPYVIDVSSKGDKKKAKLGLYDVFKVYAQTVNPALGLALGLKDTADEHGFNNYADKLAKNFQSDRVQSVDNPDFQHQQEEDKRARLKDTSMPMIDDSCQCECHHYDASVQAGLPPPQSLGTVQQSKDPALVANKITDAMDLHGDEYNSMGQQINQTDRDLMNQQADDMLDTTLDQDGSGLQDLINTAIEKQSKKDEDELNKLQDKYATLTNQDIADADPVTQSREAYKRHEDDMSYFDDRINEELQHPERVPNDDPLNPSSGSTARDTAIKFKNSLNQLYASIMSRQSSEDARQLDTRLVEQDSNQNEAEVEAITDQQQDQLPQAQKDGLLDEEHQSGDYVFDYRMLGDLNNLTEEGKNQLTEWLKYPGVTTSSLFESLKKQMVADYKGARIDALMVQDNTLKAQSVNDLREKITKKETDMRLASQSSDFMQGLASNDDFKSMVSSGQITIDKVISAYKGKDSELELLNNILGYDPATHTQSLQSQYEEGVREIQSQQLPPDETGKAMTQLAQMFGILDNVPWLDKSDLDQVYKDHPNEGPERDQAIEQLSESKARSRGGAFRGSQEDDGEQELKIDLNKDAQYEFDYSDEVKDGTYVDGWEERRDELDKEYSDPEKLKALFETWNQGDKTKDKDITDTITNGILGGPFNPMFWTSMDNLRRDQMTGWFTKEGKRLGVNASPDFVRYVREHPELGIFYRDGGGHNPLVEKVNGVFNSVVGLAMGAEFGVPMGPMDLSNMINGLAGNDSKGPAATHGVLDGYLGSYQTKTKDDEGESGSSQAMDKVMQIGQMAAMMAFQRSSMSKGMSNMVNKGSAPKLLLAKGETTGWATGEKLGHLAEGFKIAPQGVKNLQEVGQRAVNQGKAFMNQGKSFMNQGKTFMNETKTSMSKKYDTFINQRQGFTDLHDESDLAIPVRNEEKPPGLMQRATERVKAYNQQRADRKLDELYRRHQTKVDRQPNMKFKFNKIE